jgi:hypothetical protein
LESRFEVLQHKASQANSKKLRAQEKAEKISGLVQKKGKINFWSQNLAKYHNRKKEKLIENIFQQQRSHFSHE